MRALTINAPSTSTANVTLMNVPEPIAGRGELLIDVSFGGLNYADLMLSQGIYPHPKNYPLIAGFEISGRINAVGDDVEGFNVGDRVACYLEDAGAFTERCIAKAAFTVKLPDEIDLRTGAAFFIQAMTAWNMLNMVSNTTGNDTILIHAIGGGVGLYLTQMAKLAGTTVIGTVGTAGKEHRALEYGADYVINRQQCDFVTEVLKITEGRGVDKIFDSVGAGLLDHSFAAIRRLGQVISFGEAEGHPFINLWERLVSKSLTFTRYHLGHTDFSSPVWAANVVHVLSAIADGQIKVPIEHIVKFEEYATGFELLASRRISGKVLLEFNHD